MKVKFLKPGDQVLMAGRVMTFQKRYRHGHETNGPTESVFQCDDYVGLDGPADKGMVNFSDRMFAVNFPKRIAAVGTYARVPKQGGTPPLFCVHSRSRGKPRRPVKFPVR